MALKKIISVSRRTDIPAFYSEWFLKRISEGFAGDIKGMKGLVSIKPEDVLCFVFWSKNYKPFLKALRIIDDMGYNSIFHFTITGLPKIFESTVVETEIAIDTLKEISKRHSPEHIIWRYDPIVISDITKPGFHIKTFEHIASSLKGYVERCAISYIKRGPRVEGNLQRFKEEKGLDIIDPDAETKRNLADKLATIAEKCGIQLQVCWGNPLAGGKIERARCTDGDAITKLFNIDGTGLKPGPTRPGCGCTKSTDIGADNTCPHGCVYCYASTNKDRAKDAYDRHDKNSVVVGRSKADSDEWLAKVNAKRRKASGVAKTDENAGQTTKKKPKKEIKKMDIKTNFLVIAPHHPEDDDYTDVIAEQMQKELGCYAVANRKFRRSQVNLNDIEEIEKHPAAKAEFLSPIVASKNEITNNQGSPLVVLIHGIKNKHIGQNGGKGADVLIGIGQGEPDRPTLDKSTLDRLTHCLSEHSIKAKLAPEGSKYCGWDRNNLNQLFRHKAHKQYYDPRVQSVQLEIKKRPHRKDAVQAQKTGSLLANGFSELLEVQPEEEASAQAIPVTKYAPVQKVKISDINVESGEDRQYIFRVISDDKEFKKSREAEIKELADSIEKDGLVHPLVLIENGNGKYRILCGFRRFQALKLLKKERADARIYKEEDLSEEERIRISLAENARRRNLNPIEIGMFLQAASGNGKKNKTLGQLGQEFGETLGIGTSHGSAKKYLKLNEIRVKGESPEIINAVLRRELPFGIAAEVLAFIKNAEDRNELYKQIVRPFKPTRPELKEVKQWLGELGNGNGLKSTLENKNVKVVIEQAQQADNNIPDLIKQLRLLANDALTMQRQGFDKKVNSLRRSVFGKEATQEHFNIVPPPSMEQNELTVQFKLTDDSFDASLDKMKKVLEGKGLRQLMDLIANP